MPHVGGLHIATVVHSLVVGNILLLIVRVGYGTDCRIAATHTQVDGNATRLVLQIDLYDTTLITRRIAQANLIGSCGHGREFERHVKNTTDTNGIGLIRPPVVHVGGNTHESLLTDVPVRDKTALEARQDILTIAATTVTVHEIRTEHSSVNADAAVQHDIAHLRSIDKDVVQIMVNTVEGILVSRARLRGREHLHTRNKPTSLSTVLYTAAVDEQTGRRTSKTNDGTWAHGLIVLLGVNQLRVQTTLTDGS